MIKKTAFLLFIALIFSFAACNKKSERVALTPNISVKLPANYGMKKQVQNNINWTFYGAMINQDEILIGKFVDKKIDTISIEKKKESGIKNMEAFMKPYNARKLESSEKIVGDLVQNDFNFEFDQKDTSFAIFAKLIQVDSTMLILSFKTLSPISEISLKDKTQFFKSVRYH